MCNVCMLRWRAGGLDVPRVLGRKLVAGRVLQL